MKLKVSRKKKITKDKAEINGIETKKILGRINEVWPRQWRRKTELTSFHRHQNYSHLQSSYL